MRRLLICADGNTQIGLGHVVRCRALAAAWPGRVTFITMQKLWTALGHLHPTMIVLDDYVGAGTYQQAIRNAGHRLLVIDDTNPLSQYHADILLNHNITAESLSYVTDPDTKLLCGPRYALLRHQFAPYQEWQRYTPTSARHILVTMGGSDPANMTGQVLAAIAQLPRTPPFTVRVILGAANQWEDAIRSRAKKSPHLIQMRRNVTDMAKQMQWADLAICAGGGTCLELAFMGVPMIVYPIADNQQATARAWCAQGVAVSGNITAALQALLPDQSRREAMSKAGRALVDGRGVARVIAAVQELA